MRPSKKQADAEKLLLLRVLWARDDIIQSLLDSDMLRAPAATLMGDAAPQHVRIAAEIASLDCDSDDFEKPALRFLLAVMLHQGEDAA